MAISLGSQILPYACESKWLVARFGFPQASRCPSYGRPTGLAPRRVFTEPCHHGNAWALTLPTIRWMSGSRIPVRGIGTRFQPYSSSVAKGYGGSHPCGFERYVFCCTIPVPRGRLLRPNLAVRNRQRRVSRCPDFPPPQREGDHLGPSATKIVARNVSTFNSRSEPLHPVPSRS